jgi:hypothetical protein
MKTTSKMLITAAVFAALSAPLIASAAVNVDVNIGFPGYATVLPQPVYYPQVTYYTPAPRAYVHHRDWDRREYRHEYRHDDRRDYRHEERRHW